MKATAILSVLVTLTAVYLVTLSPSQDSNLESEFYSFMTKYDKSYNSETELEFRMQVFKENLEKFKVLGEQNPSATFGVNMFADLTTEEFSKMLGDLDIEAGTPTETWTTTSEPNESISWKSKMSPIQNQKSCGSCWSFAATATFEAYSNIRGTGLTKLSEQELVDCVPTCSGCGGGLAHLAYDWLSQGNVFCTEKSYPYEAADKSCRKTTCDQFSAGTDGGHGMVTSGEKGMIEKLRTGPISVSVDASVWHGYTGGVLDSCGVSTNHAVVVVEYDSSDSGVWVIRNSWGPEWGESGHIRLRFGKNVCNITKRPSYPTY